MNWKIYYGDGSTYKDNDHPENAPKRNIIAIAQANEITGHCIERGTDYYCWFDSYWRGCDIFGLFDYMAEPGYKLVLFGRWATHEEYRAIVRRATQDPDLPKRSAWFREERRPD